MLGVIRAALVTGDISTMLRASEQLGDAKNKDRFEENIGILQTLVRDLFAITAGAAELINSDIADELGDLAGGAGTARLAAWQLEIEGLLAGLNVNVNRKVAVDGLFVRMAT